MAEEDWEGAEKCVEAGLAILAKFEIPNAAWRLHGTGWDLQRVLKNDEAAESHRKSAEVCLRKLANSFEPEEPLRASLLGTVAVGRLLPEGTTNKRARQAKRTERTKFRERA